MCKELLKGALLSAALGLIACDSSNTEQSASTSMFNPDLPDVEDTGESGGDTSAIAGLWDGTIVIDGATDVVYWSITNDGVLTRYDYQQDAAENASGENCYVIGEPISVSPEAGADYSLFNVAVTAVRSGEAMMISFGEPDRNDVDNDGDITESPVFNWNLLATPVLEDLNSCTVGTEVADDALTPIPEPGTNESVNQPDLPFTIETLDISEYSFSGKPLITTAECGMIGGTVIGDPGDGQTFQPNYRCPFSGVAPTAYIRYLEGEPIPVEGAVCCV